MWKSAPFSLALAGVVAGSRSHTQPTLSPPTAEVTLELPRSTERESRHGGGGAGLSKRGGGFARIRQKWSPPAVAVLTPRCL